MTWTISAKGTMEDCAKAVEASTTTGFLPSVRMHERAKVIVAQELARLPAEAVNVEVVAHGDVPDGRGGRRITSITVSADIPPLPAVTATLRIDEGADTKVK